MSRAFAGVWFRGLLVGGVLVGLLGCKGESSEDNDEDGPNGPNGPNDPNGYCARAIAKLNGCGMGALLEDASACEEPDDDEQLCVDNCILSASCDELRALVCTAVISPALQACATGCQPPPFTCGSGESLPSAYRCDGFSDCLDGSDEVVGCPMCGSGETFPDYARCDGYPDCADGIDETGCPTFTCQNGETVPESAECDAFPDCADGSDEHGRCPDNFRCANGEIIPASFECDSYPDCFDSSDEHSGCPSVTCADGSSAAGERCDGNFDCFDASDEPASCPPTPQERICGTQ